MSISNQELQDSYFQPDETKNQETEVKPPDSTSYYALLGSNESLDDSGQPILYLLDKEGTLINETDCFAKRVNDTYFIKAISGKIFNPMGMYSDRHKFKKQAGSYAIKWERVAKTTFDNYLTFLRTKNEAYFLLAERAQTYG